MKAIFGAVIAFLLLVLYVYLIREGILVVRCATTENCATHPIATFTAAMGQTLATVGGLVSALVVAELAVADPGKTPVVQRAMPNASPTAVNFGKCLVFAYLTAWVAAGAWAFIVTLRHADTLPALTDLAHAWFGLAVAAAYAYFGIKHPSA